MSSMSTSVCRMCLGGDTKMQRISGSNIHEVYVKLTGDTPWPGDGRPAEICYICRSELEKCIQFLDMYHKSDQICTELLNNSLEITPQTLNTFKLRKDLSVTTIEPISIIDVTNAGVIIKKEMKEEKTIKCNKLAFDDKTNIFQEDGSQIESARNNYNLRRLTRNRLK